ncbi:MAG TPA: HNH endonuclease, partial [Candidatus Binatia bacterium]|nr:HNH endonuclease [Candidatus Binatia bacterium]
DSLESAWTFMTGWRDVKADNEMYMDAGALLRGYAAFQGRAAVGMPALTALSGPLGTALRLVGFAAGSYQLGQGIGQVASGNYSDGATNISLGTLAIFGNASITRSMPGVLGTGSARAGAPSTAVIDDLAGPVTANGEANAAQYVRLKQQYHALDDGLHQKAAERGYPGIGLTENGNPNFNGTPYLYPISNGQKNVVQIEMTGTYYQDFKAANLAAGFPGAKPPRGYTWHHLDDFNPQTRMTTMQLAQLGAHEATVPHFGSVSQYQKHFGVKYK